MPILWRYLISHFLKIAVVCVLAFVAILLTMQLDDIAHFAALGAPIGYILLFTFHQIPYILPIAIPLSCLIASLLLVQNLSHTHELTALRASGFALWHILAPIWLIGAFLTVGNFWIASEWSTQSHLQTNMLKNELRAINPLLLLNNKHVMRLKGFYFDTLGASHVGESSSDNILAFPNRHQERLHLMLAKHLQASSSVFVGENVTLITGLASDKEEDFDPLFIENINKSHTHVNDFSDVLQKKVWTINNDYLQMPLLLSRIQEQRHLVGQARINGGSKEELKALNMQLNRSFSEIMKRFSIAIAVLSFTLMGSSFGIHIGRKQERKRLYLAILLTIIFLVSFFVAKGLEHHRFLAAILYLGPHLLIICVSLFVLRRVAKGIES